MSYESIKSNFIDNTKSKIFLDESGSSISRFDKLKYKMVDRLTEEQLSFFWRPEEINLLKDQKDYRSLQANEQHIFSSNIKRQIVLDTIQSKNPSLAFIPLVTLPEMESWLTTWSFSESIHSRSYTHIIRNVYSDPSIIFDDIMNNKEIIECTHDISEHYDDLINYTNMYNYLGEGKHVVNGKVVEVSKYELKKKIWLCINSVNVLEGIRFYVSFACSFAFAELKKMEGNAKIIRFICRDENLHLGSTQMLLKLLPKDDEDFAKIAKECELEVISLFNKAIEQEKRWADYLFKDGSMIGLNAKLLSDYVDYIGQRRMESIGLVNHKPKANPLPWTQKWISSETVQVAAQEVENSSYRVGDAVLDVGEDSFKQYKL